MKTIEKRKRRTLLSIFAVAVFLLGTNEGFSQTAPAYSNACPIAASVTLPAGGGTITLTDANIPTLLGTNAFDPDGVSAITYSASPSSVDCSDIGPVMITVTATDVDGSTDCVVNATVVDGGPTAVCQDITVDVGSGAVTVMPADIDAGSAGCVAPVLTIMGGNPTYDCTDIAGSPYMLTLDAGGGVTCMATVTLVDNINPTITCPSDITVNADAGLCTASGVALGTPTTADVCGVASTTNNAPTSFPQGVTTVTWTVTDNNGNTNTCDQDVSVVDAEPPVAMCQDVTVSLDAGGNGTIVAADLDGGSTDNCSTAGALSFGASQTSFTCADLGANSVTLTVTDSVGLMHTCIAMVTVQDTMPPALYPNIGPFNNSLGNCEATVTWPSTLNDACAGAVVPTNVSAVDVKGNNVPVLVAGPNFFGDFPVGVSTVTYDVSDGTNNLTAQTFTITVVDAEAPTISCPTDQTQEITSCAPMQMVPSFIGLATFADNCATNLTVTQIPAPNTDLTTVAGVSNPPADGDSYTVMIEVNDGFSTTSCGPFTVTLSEDDAPQPDMAGATIPMATSTCGPLVVTAPTATDACGNPVCGEPFPVDPLIWNQVPGTGPCPGAAVPAAGASTDTPVTINDLSCFNGTETNSVINIAASGTIGTDAVLDAVGVNISHTWNTDLDISLISPAGTILNLSDDNGGTGDDYDAIFQDGGADITSATSPITGVFQAEGGTFASTFAGESITGNWTLSVCDDEFILDGTLNAWDISFSTTPTGSVPQYEFQPGNHVITWIYDDGNGNSSSQLQQINVSNDAIDPVVTCQDITLELDGMGNASFAPDELVAVSGFTMEMTEDFDDNANNPGRVSMSVTATSNTTFTFDWDYENNDAGFEGLFYLVNGAGVTANGTLIASGDASGNTMVSLMAGDVFTIQIFSPDNLFGESSDVTIDNFSLVLQEIIVLVIGPLLNPAF